MQPACARGATPGYVHCSRTQADSAIPLYCRWVSRPSDYMLAHFALFAQVSGSAVAQWQACSALQETAWGRQVAQAACSTMSAADGSMTTHWLCVNCSRCTWPAPHMGQSAIAAGRLVAGSQPSPQDSQPGTSLSDSQPVICQIAGCSYAAHPLDAFWLRLSHPPCLLQSNAGSSRGKPCHLCGMTWKLFITLCQCQHLAIITDVLLQGDAEKPLT